MQVALADLAKEFGLIPGQVAGVIYELGLTAEHGEIEADNETVDLVRMSLADLKGSKELSLPPHRTPRDIAAALGVPDKEIQKTLMLKLKVMATLTTALEPQVAEKLAAEFGYKLSWVDQAKPIVPRVKEEPAKEKAVKRPPVVTILGHVDHGKTSLLDYIRKTNVAGKEHGGITQHIGAYQVELPDGKITFLDTPGHEAFTAMRLRGAQATDIAVLVVAADDGIMPQTIEAINHVKSAKVPIIVAVNKIDKPNANPDRITVQLPEHELIPEAYGGQVIVCPVSAVTGEGVQHLLEMVVLQADMMELTGSVKAPFQGIVIEAKIDKGRGPVATVLVKQGLVKIGDTVVAGNTWGKIKAMTDYLGERIMEAGPSVPVEILGFNEAPMAGDKVEPADDERTGRNLAEGRASAQHRKSLVTPKRKVTLRDLRRQMEEEEVRDLNLIVKADVQGSVEAVRGMLEKIKNAEVVVKIIHSGVGTITESDILLASAADAICVGFNVKPEAGAKREAERTKVEIRTYTIIYELLEDIEKAVKGMLTPKFVEEYMGTVEVRNVFKLTRSGLVAGCHVTDGKVTRNCSVRVKRNNVIVYEGKLASLRNVKQDVREMNAGQDCGLKFNDWEGFSNGDIIESYELVQQD